MVSKNNHKFQSEKNSDKKQRFSLRKLNIGVASVLLGSTFFLFNGVQAVHADITTPTEEAATSSANSTSSSSSSSSSATSSTTSSASASSASVDSSAASSTNSSSAQSTATDTTSVASSASATSSADSTTANSASNSTSTAASTAASAASSANSSSNVTSDSTAATSSAASSATSTNSAVSSLASATSVSSADSSSTATPVSASTEADSAAILDTNLAEADSTASASADTDNLATTLSDGTELSISRSTIGATGDTSALTVTIKFSNVKQGDTYTLTIPAGETYSITATGQDLTTYGTTTVTRNSDGSYTITDTITKSVSSGTTFSQTFTLTPTNNYLRQSVPMTEIGDVTKTVTLTKTSADGTTTSSSVNFTQIISPEMNPTFSRTKPSSSSTYLLPNIDYTYTLNIGETTGVASGTSYASNQVNSAVNSGTTITIPVPTGFTLDANQTALANAFTDGTTITQPDGAGGNIIITVPAGSGSQNYQGKSGYQIVGYYAVDQPDEDTVVTASGDITIVQTVTKADGTTYQITKTLDPWTDTLAGKDTLQNNAIVISASNYASSNEIPKTVDTSKPVNTFGFGNNTASNITNGVITINFADGLEVTKVTTPVDAANLPGTTSYEYEATLSDGTTISGTVTAGGEIDATSGTYMTSLVLKPNFIASGASTSSSGTDYSKVIAAYGTVADTLRDGTTAVTDGTILTSSITASYQPASGGTVTTKTLNISQTVTEAKAALIAFGYQSSETPGVNDAGYLSVYKNLLAANTATTIYEPIFYYVLPENTYYDTSKGIQVPNGSVSPTVTEFTVNGREVVKIDYTGTGYSFNTQENANNQIYISNNALATAGSYPWAIYVYSPTTKMSNAAASTDTNYSSDYTEGLTDNVYLIGNGTWNIGTASEVGIDSIAKGNTDTVAVTNGSSNDKGSSAMQFEFRVDNGTSTLSNATAIINLAGDADFTLTGPITSTTTSNATVLYSTSTYTNTNNTSGAQPDLSNYVTADQVTDWSAIKSIAIELGTLSGNSAIFEINGEDANVAEDAGKTAGISTYLFADNMLPASSPMSDNATITVSGTSTVNARVAYTDADGTTHYVDLDDLTKTYTDNSSTMEESDFALTSADLSAIETLIADLKSNGTGTYRLDTTPTIVNGDKTWTTDATNGTAAFGETVKYYFEGDIVQYNLVKEQTISYQIIDDTTGTTLESENLGTADQNSTVSSDVTTAYDAAIQKYLDEGYVLVSDDTVPTSYGTADQVLTVHLIHGTTTSTDTKAVTRTINYYDKTTGATMPTNLVSSQTQTANFSRTTVKDAVTGSVLGYNTSGDYTTYTDLNGNEVKVYKVDTTDADSAWTSTDNTWSEVDNPDLESYGYEPATDADGNALTSEAETTVSASDTDQTINVYYAEHTVPVDATTTITAGQPVSTDSEYVWPSTSEYDASDFTSTSTRKISYQYADGTEASSPVTQAVTFNRTGTLNLVTGAVTTNDDWTATSSTTTKDGTTTTNDRASEYGAVTSPTITGYTASVATVPSETATQGANAGDVVVTYTADAQNLTYTVYDSTTGQYLVQNSLLATGTTDASVSDDTKTRYQSIIDEYEAEGYLVSAEALPSTYDDDDDTDQNVVITLTHPVVTITSSTSSDEIPSNSVVQPSDLTKTATLNVNYVNSDGTTFTGTTPSNATQTVTLEGTAYVDKVTGQLTNAPVKDANGNDIVDTTNTTTPEITWTTGTTTEVASPSETGYTASATSVPAITVNVDNSATSDTGLDSGTTVTLGKDTSSATITRTVTYTPDQQTIDYVIIDDTTGQTLTSDTLATGVSNGTVPSSATTTLEDVINNYLNEGYELNGSYTVPTTFDTDDSTNQTVTVHLKHGTETIDPSNPGKPGEKINPNDPRDDAPTYPAGSDDVSDTVTRTIHFSGAGSQTPADITQTASFTASGVLDKVTGEWITPLTWSGDGSLSAVTIPTIPGYYVASVDRDQDGNTIKATTVSEGDTDYTVNVVYAKDASAQVIYVDQDNDNQTIPNTGSGVLEGIPGQTIDYSTADTIKQLESEGYVLVSNDFDPDGTAPVYGDDTSTTSTYTVTLKHATTTVTPDDPKSTTDPLPDNPSKNYPSGVSEDDLNKTITRTINVHKPDGTTETITQTVHLTRTATVDEVTGKVTYSDWTTGSWDSYTAPEFSGYKPNISEVAGQTVTSDTADTTVDIYYTAAPAPNPTPTPTPDNPDNNGSTTNNGQPETNQSTGSSPASTTPNVGNQTTNDSESTTPTSNQQQKLPQTGNQDSKGLVGLGLASLIGMLGLLGGRRRRKDK